MISPHLSDLAARIVEVCSAHESLGGVPQNTLEVKLGAQNAQQKTELMTALNQLMQTGKVVMSTTHDRRLVFRVQSDEQAARLHGLDAADRLIYQEIEKSGAAGIASKDLRIRSSMQAGQLTKVLKTLETRRLVRKVKSVTAKNKILYMLADIEPGKEITGGAFYTDAQKFDHELVDQLQKIALRFIANKESATAKQVLDFILSHGVLVQSSLAVGDVESILEALVYDAKLEVVHETRDPYGGRKEGAKYRFCSMEQTQPIFTSVPCAVCPVFSECTEGGDISPANCVYVGRWLDHAAQLSW